VYGWILDNVSSFAIDDDDDDDDDDAEGSPSSPRLDGDSRSFL